MAGKVWRVGYSMEQFFITRQKDRDGMKMLGVDPTSDQYQNKLT